MLETITWLWEPWIPNSALTLVCGEPAKGKSTLLAHLAAGVTTRPFASRRNGIRPATVLWIHGEESWGCATLPRLKAAGADPTRVIHPDQAGDLTQRITVGQLSADLPGLVAAGVCLLIVDPLASLCETGSDWNNEGAARACLDALQQLAAVYHLPVIASRNWNKRKQGSRLDRINGSAAFRDTPRAILSCISDPLHKSRYVLCLDKWSYGSGAQPLCYDLDRTGPGGVPVFRQLGESDHEAEDLDGEQPTGAARAEWRAAHTLLRAIIGSEGLEARKVWAEAAAVGISKSAIWRAAVDLRIRRERIGFGTGGHSHWYPPAKGWPDGLETEPIRGRELGGGVRVCGDGTNGQPEK